MQVPLVAVVLDALRKASLCIASGIRKGSNAFAKLGDKVSANLNINAEAEPGPEPNVNGAFGSVHLHSNVGENGRAHV